MSAVYLQFNSNFSRASQSVFKMTLCGVGQNVSFLVVIFIPEVCEIPVSRENLKMLHTNVVF